MNNMSIKLMLLGISIILIAIFFLISNPKMFGFSEKCFFIGIILVIIGFIKKDKIQ